MKNSIALVLLLLLTNSPAISQESANGILRGRIEQSDSATESGARPYTAVLVEPHHLSRLRRFGHALADAARFTGRVSEMAIAAAIEAAAEGTQSYYSSGTGYGGS